MDAASRDWPPSASFEALRARAGIVSRIREYFSRTGAVEVETPICAASPAPDPALEQLTTVYTGPGAPQGRPLYLQTSPELAMKRLLAAGSGPIYQICKAFRDGERGRIHNPEFSLVEWYRPGFGMHELMDDVAGLVAEVLETSWPVERVAFGELFERELGLEPHLATDERIRECALDNRVSGADALPGLDRDAWLDLLLTHCLERKLGRGRMTFLFDYPASRASLARIRPGAPPVAERFELYLEGMEIANGFHELADEAEQRRRLVADNERRKAAGQEPVPLDERFLAALEQGLPDCSGVALGLDRLVMVALGSESIDEVLAFPVERA